MKNMTSAKTKLGMLDGRAHPHNELGRRHVRHRSVLTTWFARGASLDLTCQRLESRDWLQGLTALAGN